MRSHFQDDCHRYFLAIREVHSQHYALNPDRRLAETSRSRYRSDNKSIQNLFSFVSILRAMLPNKVDPAGVDLGCGSHFLVDALSTDYGWNAVGFDIDSRAIALARQYFVSNADRYKCVDILDAPLPIESGRMDFAVCNAVIQHFSRCETELLMNEVFRVLAPNGVFLVIFKKPTLEAELQLDHLKLDKSLPETTISLVDPAIFPKEPTDLTSTVPRVSPPLIRVYTLREVLTIASHSGFDVSETRQQQHCYEFVSGKGFVCGAVFLRKGTDQ